jgi:hypothetical protein
MKCSQDCQTIKRNLAQFFLSGGRYKVGKSFVKKVKEEYNHQSPGSAHAQPPHFPLAFPQKLRQLYYNKPTFSGWPLCRLLLGSLAQPITSPPNSRQCLRTGLLNAAASSIARANQTKKNSAFFCSAAGCSSDANRRRWNLPVQWPQCQIRRGTAP